MADNRVMVVYSSDTNTARTLDANDIHDWHGKIMLDGHSDAVQHIGQLAQHVADKKTSVLITGESGTGKEVLARGIHTISSRSKKPFLPLNCAAIPTDLLESELFGHEKGAFTGAVDTKTGRFEAAHGGTLFLDEIGDMSLHMQAKLLRVLQEKTFERVGSTKTYKADVRIIAATHRNLKQMVSTGEFREDLYYRLNVFPIELPPLRERREDIQVLIESLSGRLLRDTGCGVKLTPDAVDALSRYDWPGNVRELANILERLSILYPEAVVDVSQLPASIVGGATLDQSTVSSGAAVSGALPQQGIDLKGKLEDVERHYIRQALQVTDGVVARAARLLGLRRTTLVEKLRKYEVATKELAVE